jgi:hypothetical protein
VPTGGARSSVSQGGKVVCALRLQLGLSSSWAGLPEWAAGESGRSWAGAGQKAERSEGEEEILFFFLKLFFKGIFN